MATVFVVPAASLIVTDPASGAPTAATPEMAVVVGFRIGCSSDAFASATGTGSGFVLEPHPTRINASVLASTPIPNRFAMFIAHLLRIQRSAQTRDANLAEPHPFG